MKLILFDFDGVLVDVLMMHHGIASEVNENLSLNEFRSLFNGNIYETLAQSPHIKQNPKFFERYDEQSRELMVPEELKDTVSKLSESYTLAIVSATPSWLIIKLLKQAGAYEYFGDILGGDVHQSKIAKNKMLLEKYKVSPEDAVFITDTTGDIKEARECGIKSVAVTWGFHEKETLEKANPEKLVDTPADLLRVIKELL